MDFKDRIASYPGRVKLTPVSGQSNVYDMELEDGASVSGTPLNAATFDSFKQDLINYVNSNPGPQGLKGDKGDPGVSISNKTFLVGTNSPNREGWYKLGTISFSTYIDYHAKILITSTFFANATLPMPSGLLSIDIRKGDGDWEKASVVWETFKGENPEYIKYYLSSSGTLTLYAYIPQQWAFYRVDVISESNRDVFTNLFSPSVNYGGIWQTRYTSSEPVTTAAPECKCINFYSWVYYGECKEDSVISCTKSVHGINNVMGAIVVPMSHTTGGDLNGYDNFAVGNLKYGVLIQYNTVYVALDVGTFKQGFYCLIYGA